MKILVKKVVWFLGCLTVFVIAPVWAENTVQESTDAVQESVEVVSEDQRVRRIREVIELDRAWLKQAKANQPQLQTLFDQLAEGIVAWKEDQQDKRLRLEQTSDPEKRATLERKIAKLDDELELLRTQSELAFSALTTVRQQIEVLEKKVEREQRTVDSLLGIAPKLTEVASPTLAPADQQPNVIPPSTDQLMAPARTVAQIEAVRELKRRQREVAEAEQDLVEFVKRKRSLEQQMALEAKLLDIARKSEVGLPLLLETRRADLESVRAVAPNGT